MNMQTRWNRLVNGVSEWRRMLLEFRRVRVLVGADSTECSMELAWGECKEKLQTVLIPHEQYSLLVNRLGNAYRYYLDAEVNAAVWEVTQALRLLEQLRQQQGYEM